MTHDDATMAPDGPGVMHANAPASGPSDPDWRRSARHVDFSIEVRTGGPSDADVDEEIAGIVEAQADLLRSAILEAMFERGYPDFRVAVDTFDPMHPDIGQDGNPRDDMTKWRCSAAEAEHWPTDPDRIDSPCGYCGADAAGYETP